MPTTKSFTVELAVAGRPVTVFGADGPAIGRIATLRDAGAQVTVVAEHAGVIVRDLADRGIVSWRRGSYRPSDLDGPRLVVAATGDADLDDRIADAAEARALWCVTPATDGGEPADGPSLGAVTLVGGGPGDPGLLTVAGRDALRRADVVVVDRLAPLAALEEVREDALVLDAAKAPNRVGTAQDEINRMLVEHATAGKDVVRLKGGDNFLFGRGGEELQACAAAGVPVHVVPGVSSALAVPAAANIPITHRGLNQGFTVVSGHVPPGDPRSTVDYTALARSGTALVLMMAVATLGDIAHALVAGGLDPQTPAATIADGTLPSQQVVRGTVVTIADEVATADIGPPAITVIGTVAGFDPLG